MPTAIVVGSRRAIDRSDSTATGDTVSAQYTDEPPANPTKVARCARQGDLVVKRGLFTSVTVRHRVYETKITIPIPGRGHDAHAGRFFAKPVCPDNGTRAVTTEKALFP